MSLFVVAHDDHPTLLYVNFYITHRQGEKLRGTVARKTTYLSLLLTVATPTGGADGWLHPILHDYRKTTSTGPTTSYRRQGTISARTFTSIQTYTWLWSSIGRPAERRHFIVIPTSQRAQKRSRRYSCYTGFQKWESWGWDVLHYFLCRTIYLV